MMPVVVTGLRDIIGFPGKIQRFRRICPEIGQKCRVISPVCGNEHHLSALQQPVCSREAERVDALVPL